MLKSLGLSGAIAAQTGGRLVGFQVLTGAGTYTPPAGVSALYIASIGAGGGSGGITASSTVQCVTGGGGAGAVKQGFVTPLAASYAYSCGVGGIAGTPNGAGGNGGQTTFGSIATASGGSGSAGQDATASPPTVAIPGAGGGTGGASLQITTAGSSGSPGLISGLTAMGGAGGDTFYGTGGQVRTTTGDGSSGTGFGAGASGANTGGGGTNRNGGAGTQGAVLVWEYS